MCGIAVVVGDDPGVSLAGVDTVSAAHALTRRGPDETVTLHDGSAVFISSRLTHWTAGAATQPYVGPDGTTAVFNGELFNLEELAAGVGMAGGSEIAVLAEGIRTVGVDFLTRVDGQFAVVVRVGQDGPVYAARDRFGVCPLYVVREGDRTAVASNLAALTALTGRDHPLSAAGLAGIVTDWAPTGGRTPYEGIHQVLPGHAVLLNAGDAAPVRWSAPPVDHDDRPSDLADFETRLRDSVAIRMRSTTPIACLLSGGIDSTVIGGIAAELGASTGIGLYLDGDDLVRDRQRQVADALQMSLIHHRLDPVETVDLLAEYVATRRIPLVRLGPVGMMSLARRTRAEGIRGVLSGEGADELFAGYDSYRLIAARAGMFGDPQGLPWSDFGAPEFGIERGPRWARAYWRGLIALSPQAPTRRGDVMRPVFGLLRPPLIAALEQAQAGDAADQTLVSRRQADIDVLLGSYLLTVQGDHAWMEEGVELRPPYLGNPVADWALAQDPASFLSLADGKLPVRQLLARLAVQRPALAGLGFAKAAFRVDSSFVLRSPEASGRLRELMSRCPQELVDAVAVRERWDRCVGAGTCSEAESMLFLLTASLGVLA
jgi:asparagine synthase (glutamine-hydrolysing)